MGLMFLKTPIKENKKRPQGFRLAVFLLDPPTPFRGRRRGKDL